MEATTAEENEIRDSTKHHKSVLMNKKAVSHFTQYPYFLQNENTLKFRWFCRRHRTWLKDNFNFNGLVMMHRSQIIFSRLNRATVVVIFQSDTCSWFEIDTRDECRNFHFLSLAFSLSTAVCFMLLLLAQRACLNLIFSLSHICSFEHTNIMNRAHCSLWYAC